MAAFPFKGEEHFLDQHRNYLIQHITMVHPVLDRLLQGGLLTQEQYDIVTESVPITQEKMRVLYRFTSGWSVSHKDTLYQALKTSNPGVIENLEGKYQSENGDKTSSGDPIQDWRVQYMTVMKQKFQCIREHNSRIGEAVSLDRRYTRLLMVKRYQRKKEKEHELMALGLRHQQIMEERSSDECACTSLQTMFDPNEEGVIPKIVVVQGPAGIGKTMTSKKIMLDWASGNLFHDKFSFVFYLSCRELNTVTDKISLGRLLSRTSKFQFPEHVMQSILSNSNSKKLLFVIDGFDEARWTLKDNFTVCGGPLQETHQEVLLRSLVNKRFLCEASLVITTRPFALEKLDELIEDVCSCHMEILGFTEEDCEEYFHNSFRSEDDAGKALGIIKDNDVLHTMCAVPITCWIVCTVLKQEIKKDLDLILCRTATSVYLLYLKGLLKYHGRNQPTHNCLKKLCALANEGILKQQILFQEEDLERHGLSLSEVESVFLNESIFHQDIDSSTCYSFIHLSMQEFFAAIYYVMEEVSRGQVAFLPEICEGNSLSQLSSSSPHLALTLQFLFGLTNEKQLEELSRITRHNVSFQAARAIRDWLVGEDPSKYRTQTICCLYETQDEDFVRAVMCRSKGLEFRLMEGKFCTRELAYCLKFSADISALTFVCNIMGQKDLEVLSPFMQRCSYLKIACYVKISSVPCNVLRELIITSQTLKQLDLSEIHLRDSDVHLLCGGLRDPGCTLQELSLFCDLSHFTCHELRTAILVAKPSLELRVIFHVSFTMAVSEAEKLCQTLRLPNCTFLNDSILHDRMARLFHKTIYFAYKKVWCSPSSSTVRRGGFRPCFGSVAHPTLFGFGAPLGPGGFSAPHLGFFSTSM